MLSVWWRVLSKPQLLYEKTMCWNFTKCENLIIPFVHPCIIISCLTMHAPELGCCKRAKTFTGLFCCCIFSYDRVTAPVIASYPSRWLHLLPELVVRRWSYLGFDLDLVVSVITVCYHKSSLALVSNSPHTSEIVEFEFGVFKMKAWSQ